MWGSHMEVVIVLAALVILVQCLKKDKERFWKNRPDRDEYPTTPEEIELRLLEDKIIPDVVSKAPKDFLKVEYKSKLARVNFGQVIRCGDTTPDPPISLSWPASESDYYTLLMTDRDAALEIPPHAPEWQHWMVVNIHGSNWKKGDVRTDYMGAFIPNWLTYDTGPHRFVFTLWRQKNGITKFQQKFIHNLVFDLRRTNFSTPIFSEKYNLELVAINYFRADWHEMPHDRETLLRPSTPPTPRPTFWDVITDPIETTV